MNKFTLLVLLCVALTVSACSGGSEQVNDITNPFIGGNAALNLYLQNGVPPPTVFDGGTHPFAIGVVAENIGETDIGANSVLNPFFQLRLEGLLPTNFAITDADLLQDQPTQLLRGARKNFDGTVLPGEIHNAIFQPLNFQPNLQGNQVHAFRVKACYDYTNFATAMLCMKDEILESAQDSTICTLTGPKPVANSGGPIHVTEVTQNPMDANRIQVNIRVEHVGTGDFYGRGLRDDGAGGLEQENCDPSVRNTNKHIVDMNVSTDDGASIVCHRIGGGNSGRLTMYQGSPQIVTCIIDNSVGAGVNSRIYQSSLNVALQYRYGEFIEDKFVVQAVPQ